MKNIKKTAIIITISLILHFSVRVYASVTFPASVYLNTGYEGFTGHVTIISSKYLEASDKMRERLIPQSNPLIRINSSIVTSQPINTPTPRSSNPSFTDVNSNIQYTQSIQNQPRKNYRIQTLNLNN
ncbi:hypothetical protein DID78_00310 [Candidatus Marinamargulisbacteria bacterium SCGC AG-343-D04]|nr:hypothetical protein DID78_00310 [Candidatus Marinamargulisbacteria bacterium SCGC AG-343-D04]